MKWALVCIVYCGIRAYWWGGEIGVNQANCRECGSERGEKTAPVGDFAPNKFRLHDTAGNVWEWVEDCWHDSYEDAPEDGSAWLEKNGGDCDRRVFRGGAWNHIKGSLRVSYRYWSKPDYRNFNGGFRLAQDIP